MMNNYQILFNNFYTTIFITQIQENSKEFW